MLFLCRRRPRIPYLPGPAAYRLSISVADKPRLLVIVNVYRPDLGGGVLFADLAEGLAARGFDITVRCAYPYYPEWRDKTGRNGLAVDRRREQGVLVERYGLFVPTKPNRLVQRLAYEASFFLSLLRDVPDRGRFDAVMAFCPLVGAVAFGAMAAHSARVPLWLNVQDLSADAASASGIIRSGGVARILSGIQTAVFNRAGTWTTISPVMADRLAPLRKRSQPLHMIPNWLHDSLADMIAALPSKSGRAPGRPVKMLYSGNVGAKQDLIGFCRALARTGADFAFRIQGGGAMADSVRSWVADSGDGRFSFHRLSDEAGLARALHETDLFVVTETYGAGGSFIPSKILPAMASATPMLVVCDADSPLGREMTESEAGPVFRWDTVDDVGPLLANLPDRTDVFATWQENALRRAALYDRTTILDRYADLLRGMITSAGTPPERQHE